MFLGAKVKICSELVVVTDIKDQVILLDCVRWDNSSIRADVYCVIFQDFARQQISVCIHVINGQRQGTQNNLIGKNEFNQNLGSHYTRRKEFLKKRNDDWRNVLSKNIKRKIEPSGVKVKSFTTRAYLNKYCENRSKVSHPITFLLSNYSPPDTVSGLSEPVWEKSSSAPRRKFNSSLAT